MVDGYSLGDLENLTGVKRTTIRYYIGLGALPHANGRGRYATYGEEHVRRLRTIRKAKDHNVTLAELAERFGRTGRGR